MYCRRLYLLIYLILIFILPGCQESLTNLNPLSNGSKNNKSTKAPAVSTVEANFDRITLKGSNLDLITGVKVTGWFNDKDLSFLSQSESEVQAAVTSGTPLTFYAGKTYSLIVSSSGSQNTLSINFQIPNNAITTSKLQTSSISASKIASKAVSLDKIDTSGASDGDLLRYSASSGKFLPSAETTLPGGEEEFDGVTQLTLGSGLVGNGSSFASTGTVAVNIGAGANQILSFDQSGNLSLERVLAIDHSADLSGYLSLNDSQSKSDFRFSVSDSLKLIYTDDYSINTDPALYPLALEIEDDGVMSTTNALSLGGKLTVNGVSTSYNLPTTKGSNNQFLVTNGIGQTFWQTVAFPGAGTVTQVDAGVGFTAGSITGAGTISVDVGTTVDKIVRVENNGRVSINLMPYGIIEEKIATGLVDNTEFEFLNNINVASTIQNRFNSLPSTYQARDDDLDDLSLLFPTANNFIVGNGAGWTLKTPDDTRTALGLGSMALTTQDSNSVAITGGTITGTMIGASGAPNVWATNMNALNVSQDTFSVIGNFSSTGNFSVNGTIGANADVPTVTAMIGSHPSYTNYAAFWGLGNAHYALLANSSNVYLNANAAAGVITFASNSTSLGNIDGTSGNLTLKSGASLVIPTGAGLMVHGNWVIEPDNDWLRTYGDTGWYNETWGGGWWMAENSTEPSPGERWLTVYGDKRIETTGDEIKADKAIIGDHPDYGASYSAFWREGFDYSVLTDGVHTYLNAPSDDEGVLYFRQSNENKMYITVQGSLVLISGTAQKTTQSNWAASSDRRLKDIHGNYEKGLAEIRKVNPIIYNYKKNNPKEYDSSKVYQGIIAQEIMQVFPEAVEKEEDGYYIYHGNPVDWAKINAIKQLDTMIQSNREKFNLMKGGLENRERRIASLQEISGNLREENSLLRTENKQIKAFICQKHAKAAFCSTH